MIGGLISLIIPASSKRRCSSWSAVFLRRRCGWPVAFAQGRCALLALLQGIADNVILSRVATGLHLVVHITL